MTFTDWSEWGQCSATCGSGTRTRSRRCAAGSVLTTNAIGCSSVDTGNCPDLPACRTGEWSEWFAWTACLVTCGAGDRMRIRACNNGNSCPGDRIQIESCGLQDCIPVEEVQWGGWGQWSACSRTCDQGTRSRERPCLGGLIGVNCLGESTELEQCLRQSCAVWSLWTEWACSQTCDGGIQTRERTCNGGRAGVDCAGAAAETGQCGAVPCVDPTWTEWSEWGGCSITCDGGSQARTRQCDGGEINRDCIGAAYETQSCNERLCSEIGWTGWSNWTECSLTCGPGSRQRTRTCQEEIDSTTCPGDSELFEDCNFGMCPS